MDWNIKKKDVDLNFVWGAQDTSVWKIFREERRLKNKKCNLELF